jgi:hypothetical protein
MTSYDVDVSFLVPDADRITVEAETHEQAETLALEEAERKYPEGMDFEIDYVKELNNAK